MNAEVIAHPRTGEALELTSADTDTLLDVRDLLSDRERSFREIRRMVDDELIRRADHEGRRSFTFTGFKVDVNPPLEKRWDLDCLDGTLDEFVANGIISQAKADKCVRVKTEPVWREIQTLLSDPRTRDRIRDCFEEVPARRHLKVTRR